MGFINLTPHALNILKKDNTILILPPSGWVARVKVEMGEVHVIEGVEITCTTLGSLEGLEGLVVGKEAVLITSLAAREAVKAAFPQHLVTSPGALIRDANGQPIGCQGLAN